MREFSISAEQEASGRILYRVLALGDCPAPRWLFRTEQDAAQWIRTCDRDTAREPR